MAEIDAIMTRIIRSEEAKISELLAEVKRQAAEIERLRGALADSNIAAHSLASRLTGLGVRIVNDRDLINREEVMALVVRWRSMWDDAMKEHK